MPTVLRKDGYRFFFYSQEGNEPPHIHVQYGKGVAKYWLENISLANNKGLPSMNTTIKIKPNKIGSKPDGLVHPFSNLKLTNYFELKSFLSVLI